MLNLIAFFIYMKKFFCLLLVAISLFVFVGCSNDLLQIIKDNMSDLRINYFEGENDFLFADLSCGYREQNFLYDGISTEKLQCGVLSVEFKTIYSYTSICVELFVDDQKQEYILEKSPFENKYMVDLEKIIDCNAKVKLCLKNQENVCELDCVSNNWQIDYEKALKIGVEALKDDFNDLYVNGKINAEGYLKVISKNDFKQKFWYFGYVNTLKKSKGLLIDVKTGQIVANNKQ